MNEEASIFMLYFFIFIKKKNFRNNILSKFGSDLADAFSEFVEVKVN